ncbi:MAG: OmpA family protein [Mariprofundaceae bacterium]
MVKLISMLLMAFVLNACVTSPNDPNRHVKESASTGMILGAIAGAVLGHHADRTGGAVRGALAGAAVGGTVGVATGIYMGKQQQALEQQLAAERTAHHIDIDRLDGDRLRVTMSSEVSFDFDSAAIKPTFRHTLDKVSDTLMQYEHTTIHIVGHTDSVGSEWYNYGLSEGRANAVARYMAYRGISRYRMTTEGMGESEPRVSNRSESGRQLNRRVEILLIPDEGLP